MNDVTIPDEALRLAAEAAESQAVECRGRDVTTHRDDIVHAALAAAAPLIIAAELDQQAAVALARATKSEKRCADRVDELGGGDRAVHCGHPAGGVRDKSPNGYDVWDAVRDVLAENPHDARTVAGRAWSDAAWRVLQLMRAYGAQPTQAEATTCARRRTPDE